MKTLKNISTQNLIIGATVGIVLLLATLFVFGMHVGEHLYHTLSC